MGSRIKSIVVFNLDGLRPDVCERVLAENPDTELARLLATGGVSKELVSSFPSVTFTAQASLVSGYWPSAHGIVGNQYFDRFGNFNRGKSRYYGLDVGELRAYRDAVAVFASRAGLANSLLPEKLPTLFERLNQYGWSSAVFHYMYSRGASTWKRANVLDLARFKRGASLLGLSPEQYDHKLLTKLKHHLNRGQRDHCIFLYFMGLDMTSHKCGPGAQYEYVIKTLDRQLGHALALLKQSGYWDSTCFFVISDHGQVQVNNTPGFGLRLGTRWSIQTSELQQLFGQHSRQVWRFPMSLNKSDTIIAANGGMAFVYLRRDQSPWSVAPPFELVLELAQRLGKEREFFSAVLVRNTEAQGSVAPFLLLNGADLIPVTSDQCLFDLKVRPQTIHELASSNAGDLVLVANVNCGYYFGSGCKGNHGGFSQEESVCTFKAAYPAGNVATKGEIHEFMEKQLNHLKEAEGRKFNTLTDFVPLVDELVARFGC